MVERRVGCGGMHGNRKQLRSSLEERKDDDGCSDFERVNRTGRIGSNSLTAVRKIESTDLVVFLRSLPTRKFYRATQLL